jgi:SWI/SNF-related matrix-associated actin-dependent regulator 1 of chromatin subfamily A
MALKRAGFFFDKKLKVYDTHSSTVAARLREYCDESAKKEINRTLIHITPWAGRPIVPAGLRLMPHQEDMVRFAMERNRSYLACDPGTGKTPAAVTIMNANPSAWIVYVCPPFLALNVEDEINKWSTPKRVVRIFGRDKVVGRTFLVPDSRLDRRALLKAIKYMRNWADIVRCDLILIIDEAHRFNGENAIRSMALYEDFLPLFDKVVHMSGTPMPNRPLDLYNVLSNCAPETIKYMDKFEFGKRYCAGRRNRFGWDFKGSSNVKELARAIMPKYMLRVKADVLKLPPLRQEFIFIGDKVPAKVAALDAELLREHSPEDLMKGTMSPHISTYRKELGKLKVKPALPFIQSILEYTDEAFLLGTFHRDVIELLRQHLGRYCPLIIDGTVTPNRRLAIAKEFQRNPKRRFIIMNIDAGGIGFNLTRATRVLLLEPSWVPSVTKQFIGRALRYGQTRSVLAQHFVFKNSLDRRVIETGFRKEAITRHL